MGLTNRFSLTQFGGGIDGSLSRDGQKYTSRDRRVIDRVLAALEEHTHEGGERLGDPEFDPVLTLDPVGGSLRSGTTYHYAVTMVDRYGLETAPTDSVSVTTEGAISSPAPPRVEAEVGGSLDEGLYWYGLTAFQDGNETALSPPSAISITDWNTVRIEAPNGLPAGSDAVAVWRQGPLDSGFTRLVTVPVSDPAIPPDPLFTDDGSIESTCGPGCVPGPDLLPPTTNMTNSTNSVLVEIPTIDPGLGVIAWRVYRTTQPGVWTGSLVAEVVETEEELSGELVNAYLDEGGPTFPGQPPPFSQTLTPSVEIEEGGGGGASVDVATPLVSGSLTSQVVDDANAFDVQGNFLYHVTDNVVYAVDVSDPAKPREVGSVALSAMAWAAALVTHGEVLYVLDEDYPISRLVVVDISDPTDMSLLPDVVLGEGAYTLEVMHPLIFVGEEDRLRVLGGDPKAPTLVRLFESDIFGSKFWVPEFVQGAAIRVGDSIRFACGHQDTEDAHSLFVFESQAPFTDVSLVHSQVLSGYVRAPSWVSSDVVVATSVISGGSPVRLNSFSFSSLSVLDELDFTYTNASDWPEWSASAGGLFYVRNDGVKVFDARDPANLREIGLIESPNGRGMIPIIRGDYLYGLSWTASTIFIFGASPDLDLVGINGKAVAHTITLDDIGKVLRAEGDVTIPPESTEGVPVGGWVRVRQVGASQVEIIPGSGVTINSPETLRIRGQFYEVQAHKVGSDEWDLLGDIFIPEPVVLSGTISAAQSSGLSGTMEGF